MEMILCGGNKKILTLLTKFKYMLYDFYHSRKHENHLRKMSLLQYVITKPITKINGIVYSMTNYSKL